VILDLVTSAVLLLGAVFTLLAALGVVRFPDVLTRLHAAAKAGVLGAGLVVIGVAIHLNGPDALLRAGITLLFLLLTAPVAGHAIGRAAYLSRDVELSPETITDEWKQRPSVVKLGSSTSLDTSDDEKVRT
jgi:multicomponent Na+:H+ antiporter subunit G